MIPARISCPTDRSAKGTGHSIGGVRHDGSGGSGGVVPGTAMNTLTAREWGATLSPVASSAELRRDEGLMAAEREIGAGNIRRGRIEHEHERARQPASARGRPKRTPAILLRARHPPLRERGRILNCD